MKKKLLALSLVAVLLTLIVVGGSLAWFQDEDEVKNTFTMGSIKIQIIENGEVADLVEQMGQMLPILDPADPAKDPHYIDKVVQVDNIGQNNAYVRAHIAVPVELAQCLLLDAKLDDWSYSHESYATVEGEEYLVYSYDYHGILPPGQMTDAVLSGAYLDSRVDLRDDPSTADTNLVFCIRNDDGSYTYTGFAAYKDDGTPVRTVSILVAAEAIQDRGFADAQDALAQFGENPWAN